MALNPRRRAFVEHYIANGFRNGTKAATDAGYSERTAHAQAHRLLKNAEIQRHISNRLGEMAMGANEVLFRLTQQAQATMADFIEITSQGVRLDFVKAEKADKLGLIKKFKQDKDGNVTVELYDAQAALVQLGRHHQLFTDQVALVDWRREAQEAGVDITRIFEGMVEHFAADLASRDGADTR